MLAECAMPAVEAMPVRDAAPVAEAAPAAPAADPMASLLAFLKGPPCSAADAYTRDAMAKALAGQLPAKQGRRMVREIQQELARRDCTLARMDQVPAAPLAWLWPGRIACGKITLIQGHSGSGKSQVLLDLAARVSAGAPWPDAAGSDAAGSAPAGRVLILCPEDDLSDTVRPRLVAGGADLSRVVAIKALAREQAGQIQPQDLAGLTLGDLEKALLCQRQVKLVVIDSSTAFDAASAGGVKARQWLAGLARLARQHQVAVLLAAPLERSAAARAMQAIARMVWVLEPDPQDPHRRLMLPGANRLGGSSSGLALRLGEGAVQWEAQPLAVAEAVSHRGRPGPPPLCRRAAMKWLSQRLEAGAVGLAVIKAELTAAGFSWATIRRASEDMGIEPQWQAAEAGYAWRLPASPQAPAAYRQMPPTPLPAPPEQAGGRMGGFFEEAHEEQGTPEAPVVGASWAQERDGTDAAGTCATGATSGMEQEMAGFRSRSLRTTCAT